MQTFILRRLLSGIVILFVLSVTVFLLLRIVPGDPAIRICGLQCTRAQIDQIHKDLGLDKPYFPVELRRDAPFVSFEKDSQYWNYMSGVLTGDLGTSQFNHKPVWPQIKNRLPITLELMVLTMVFTIVIGIPFGVVSAVFRNSPADYFVRSTSVLGLAVPSFWVATLVLVLPSEIWGYAPVLGRKISFMDDPIGNIKQAAPAAAVLALGSAAGVMRLTRSSLLEVMRQDYMRTARAKGLRERSVVVSHGLKNSMIPVITVLGLQVSGLLGGAIIVEQIFNLPGLGQFTLVSLGIKDYDVVQTMTLYAGVTVVVMNLVVDVSYAWLDPRIRYS
ncbi:MAG: ABC transporter permease [Acidobacteriota bacterium]